MASPAELWSLIGGPSGRSLLRDEPDSLARIVTCEYDCVRPVSVEQDPVHCLEMLAPSHA
jgi:hypothetical protein